MLKYQLDHFRLFFGARFFLGLPGATLSPHSRTAGGDLRYSAAATIDSAAAKVDSAAVKLDSAAAKVDSAAKKM